MVKQTRNTKPDVFWEGVQYPSITAMAQATGVTYQTAFHRYHKGQNCEADLHRNWHEARERKLQSATKKTVVFRGVEYKSIRQVAVAYGVAHITAKRWIEKDTQSS